MYRCQLYASINRGNSGCPTTMNYAWPPFYLRNRKDKFLCDLWIDVSYMDNYFRMLCWRFFFFASGSLRKSNFYRLLLSPEVNRITISFCLQDISLITLRLTDTNARHLSLIWIISPSILNQNTNYYLSKRQTGWYRLIINYFFLLVFDTSN